VHACAPALYARFVIARIRRTNGAFGATAFGAVSFAANCSSKLRAPPTLPTECVRLGRGAPGAFGGAVGGTVDATGGVLSIVDIFVKLSIVKMSPARIRHNS